MMVIVKHNIYHHGSTGHHDILYLQIIITSVRSITRDLRF